MNQSDENSKISDSKVKSIFIKPGEYLKEYQNEGIYEFNNFEFLKLGQQFHVIGSGAFGDVFLAKNKINGKYFAIKQMEKKKVIDNGGSRDLIMREIGIHRRLIHNNIVRFYSYHENETYFYLVMDYVNKGTLYQLIKLNNGLDEKKAFQYFIQVVSAVNFLHENNLIHRDIKPENLLIDDNDEVKLCDFGWCVELKIGNRVTFCGTFEYMAPELIKELPYNQAVDVWSLGVLLYELIYGYSPFRPQSNSEADDYTQIFKNILKHNLKIDNNVSEDCADLIKKLLTLENKNRIKVKDIFYHPWVKSFEEEYKFKKVIKYEVINERPINTKIINEDMLNVNSLCDISNVCDLRNLTLSVNTSLITSDIHPEVNNTKIKPLSILKPLEKSENLNDKKITFKFNDTEEKFEEMEKDKYDPDKFRLKLSTMFNKKKLEIKSKKSKSNINLPSPAILKDVFFTDEVSYQKTGDITNINIIDSKENDNLFDKVLNQLTVKNKHKRNKNRTAITESNLEENQDDIRNFSNCNKGKVETNLDYRNYYSNTDYTMERLSVEIKGENKRSSIVYSAKNTVTPKFCEGFIEEREIKNKRKFLNSNLKTEKYEYRKNSFYEDEKVHSILNNFNILNEQFNKNKILLAGDEFRLSEDKKKRNTKKGQKNQTTKFNFDHSITQETDKNTFTLGGFKMMNSESEYNGILSTETNFPAESSFDAYINPKKHNISSSLDILERAKDIKDKIVQKLDVEQEIKKPGFWDKIASIFIPFKCDKR